MTAKLNLLDLSPKDMADFCVSLGEKPFRVDLSVRRD